ncbi:MAG: TrkA C-terminal domain-containing protein [Candidatus Nanopelagicales bacterium]|nr:TrkA C-terminal domain-containing protein [Candidatus Nanopelagicales bacterium]
MDVGEIVKGWSDLAAEQPLLLLTVIMAIGGAIGAIRIRSFSLGPAAVLFTALALSAYDDRLRLPQILGIFGLALFAYVIGVGAGPSFFAGLRTGGIALVVVVAALLAGAAATVGASHLVGLEGPILSGIYAGALTNTPALAAASEAWASDLPTVGYSVTYLFGVLGMLLATAATIRRGAPHKALAPIADDVLPPRLDSMTVRIEAANLPNFGTLAERSGHHLVFSRIMRGDSPGHPGRVAIATDETVPRPGDVITVIGDLPTIERFASDVGHPSTVALTLDRSTVDYRRIAVSNRYVAGQALGDLRLPRRFGAVATRVRRGDVDLLATDDLVLQVGDRVRIVAERSRMAEVAAFLGDSERGASAYSITSMSLGLALGVLLGELQFPMPGGGHFALGLAGGPLLVGLIVGRAGRTGPVLWTLPHSVASTLSQIGMMLFLAYAGSNSGSALADALAGPTGPRLLIVGIVVTLTTAGMVIVGARLLAGVHGARLGGLLAGAQTQPAVLAYANEATGDDPRVNLGYALVYPVAMIVKVVVAPLLGRF